MIKSLQKARIADGLPQVLKREPVIQALSDAMGKAHEMTMAFAGTSQIYTELDTAPEAVLDAMAMSWNIFWYDPSYPIERKRQIVKSPFAARKKIGTAQTVKVMLSALWPGTTVREWFEYGGEPGYFRVDTSSQKLLEDQELFLGLLDKLKRYSIQLEQLTVVQETYLMDESGNALVNERGEKLTV